MTSDYRQRNLANWERAAPGWAAASDRLSAAAREITDRMIDHLDCRPGDTVLDVAAGTGDTGYAAAARIGPNGRLIVADFSATMLAEARRRAEQLGVDIAEFRVLDAEQMDLDDASVDGVLCRYGYMLMSDPAAALRETRRVLRPGRRVALATMAELGRNPWGMFVQVLVERGAMPAPQPGTPGIFVLSDPARLASLLGDAGFTDVGVEELEFRWEYPDFDTYWRFVAEAAGAVSDVIAELSAAERAEVRDELASRVAAYRSEDGSLSFPAASLVAAGTA